MGSENNNLEALRKRKEMLKSEVSEMEKLISVDHLKDSISEFTNGYSDKFLKESVDMDGHKSFSLKTDAIMKEVANEVKDRVIGKNSLLSLAGSASKSGLVEEAVKLGVTAFIGNYAQKNLKNTNWKKRAIGLALVYVAPIVIRYAVKQLEDYQKHKSVSSLEQLI